jgi:NADH:ubiquinone oxidoreductase subunit
MSQRFIEVTTTNGKEYFDAVKHVARLRGNYLVIYQGFDSVATFAPGWISWKIITK